MKMCIHSELNFASGDYYVTCAKCNAMWMRKSRDGRPEYAEHNGQLIGAAPAEASGNVTAMTAGPRTLENPRLQAKIERLRKALEEIADPSRALLTETIRWIARDALQDQQERET